MFGKFTKWQRIQKSPIIHSFSCMGVARMQVKQADIFNFKSFHFLFLKKDFAKILEKMKKKHYFLKQKWLQHLKKNHVNSFSPVPTNSNKNAIGYKWLKMAWILLSWPQLWSCNEISEGSGVCPYGPCCRIKAMTFIKKKKITIKMSGSCDCCCFL